jgi:hypothetical protein
LRPLRAPGGGKSRRLVGSIFLIGLPVVIGLLALIC